MIDEGYISRVKHSEENLYILSYTNKTHYEWKWNEATLICRGLIVDNKWNIIARPFQKFFTYIQWKTLRNSFHHLYKLKFKDAFNGPFTVTEKLDGSLGILYYIKDKAFIATKSSFVSPQAIRGTKIFNKKYNTNKKNWHVNEYTYLFEIIYPENRIVIDYGNNEKLVMIGIIDNQTGYDCHLPDNETTKKISLLYNDEEYYNSLPPLVEQEKFDNFQELFKIQRKNQEGFVVHFENGLRVKIKFDEYVRFHKILSNWTEKRIWELLRNEEDMQSYIDQLPEDIQAWTKLVIKKLTSQYKVIENHVKEVIHKDITKRIPALNRKQLAIKYQDYEYRAIMFQILDSKQYKQSIWRLVKPT